MNPDEPEQAASGRAEQGQPLSNPAALRPLLARVTRSKRGDPAADTAVEEVEPRLLVPRELTPLPLVEQALPVLELFPGIVGRRHRLYKVALLRELQGLASG